MSDYHAVKALSAGVAWTMVSECPAQAWWESPWNPDRVENVSKDFDIGTAVHLAVLEPADFENRTEIVAADDWRTKDARWKRDSAYSKGKTPLLTKDWELVLDLRDKLKESHAAELLFGDGENERPYFWEWDGVSCKAKADRILYGAPTRGQTVLIDLKTAPSANPEAFQRAMVSHGHHLRAAWYLDGWNAAPGQFCRHGENQYDRAADYRFVVIAKPEPHLVSVFRIDEGAIEKGRTLYRRALALYRQCQETGVWPTYTEAKIQNISLPLWYEYRLADQEAADAP